MLCDPWYSMSKMLVERRYDGDNCCGKIDLTEFAPVGLRKGDVRLQQLKLPSNTITSR